MDIAILKNDSVSEPLRKHFVDYDHMIIDWLQPIVQGTSHYTVYDMKKMKKPSFNHDLYVSSGSRRSVYEDEPWIHHYRDITRDLHEKKRCHFGICFGHQMIALTLGGEVGKGPGGWGIGIHRWEAVGNRLAEESLSLCVSHQDQVLTPTPDMKVFLKSDFCPIAGFTVGGHIMTVQGHPEFSIDYTAALMEIRKSIYPEDVYLKGKSSLRNPPQPGKILLLMKNFFGLEG